MKQDVEKALMLTSVQMYWRELAQLPRLSQEQVSDLELRAQGGDAKARHALITSCLAHEKATPSKKDSQDKLSI